jgi:putative iron-regulated protein
MKIAFRARRQLLAPALLSLLAFGSSGCSDDDAKTDGVSQAEVVANYAELVAASYADSLQTAKDLDSAVQAFLEEPSQKTLNDAKAAWLKSRGPYGETEAYRFYQGPIDNDDSDDDIPEGPEGLINSWPLDESFIDYVVVKDEQGMDERMDGGIINDAEKFPEITALALSDANASVGEDTISTGYHAIEFLLWGQDLSEEGPGDRPYTDYVTGKEGTATNQARRADYLRVVSGLLVDDLSTVNSAWLDGRSNYRADFLAMPPREALGKILLGMGSLAGGELSHERMEVAYVNQEQEDEHSCFSDNTLADLRNNATSVQNVLLGHYGDVEGPGVVDLVEAKSPALAEDLRSSIKNAIDEIDAVDEPFDVAIMGADSTPNRKHIAAAIDSLNEFKDALVDAAKAIDIELKFDE